MIAMIGTGDQSCWLAEACKILLLLLLLLLLPSSAEVAERSCREEASLECCGTVRAYMQGASGAV